MPATEATPGPHRQRLLAYVLLIIAVASLGASWAAARAVHQEVAPFTLVFWRWLIAGIFLASRR